MTSWRDETLLSPIAAPPKASRRSGFMRALGLAVAALMTANAVVVAEQLTGRDLVSLVTDGFDNARDAIGRTVESDRSQRTAAGEVNDSTSTTASGSLAAPGSIPGTEVPAPGAAPDSTTSTAPPTSGTRPGTPTTTGTPVGGTATPSTTAPQAAAQAKAPTAEEIVAGLAPYVERERGLTFKSPVEVTTLDEAPFQAKVSGVRLNPYLERARRVQGTLRALDVIGTDVDLAAEVKKLSTGNVAALYDTGANELFIRKQPFTPYILKVIVHEMVHALNDQYFELSRPDIQNNPDEEAGAAFDALIQGIATRIENRFVAAMSDGDRKSVEDEQRRIAAKLPRDMPTYVPVYYAFPFAAGPRLVDAILASGGTARLNAAIQSPPTTTEHVFHPEKYLAGEGARPIAAPGADGSVVRSGSLGQLVISIMLSGQLEGDYAESAADGWGGDRFVQWQNGNQSCVRLVIDMDNAEESTELGEGLVDWAMDLPGAEVEGNGPFTVTRCS